MQHQRNSNSSDSFKGRNTIAALKAEDKNFLSPEQSYRKELWGES